MFVGREKELKILEDTYNKPGFSMTVINGRNLELLAQQTAALFAPSLKGVRFESIEALFDFITEKFIDTKWLEIYISLYAALL